MKAKGETSCFRYATSFQRSRFAILFFTTEDAEKTLRKQRKDKNHRRGAALLLYSMRLSVSAVFCFLKNHHRGTKIALRALFFTTEDAEKALRKQRKDKNHRRGGEAQRYYLFLRVLASPRFLLFE